MPHHALCTILATMIAVALGQTVVDTAEAAPKPNIVFVLADDLGWNDIGYHGSDILTPTLDRLAAAGAKLENHYVHPVCSPTRLGLIAGRGPSRYGVLSPIKSTQHLPTNTLTLPRALADVGYTTHISGKWHLGTQAQYRPTRYGFHTSYGYLHGQIDPYTHIYKLGNRTWHRNDCFIEEEGHATDLITDEAIRVIESAGEKPFFIYVAYSVPHYPLKEPDEWLAPYQGKIADPWRRLFAASVTHMDAGVGRIVEALDRSGKRENTLFIFTSDNGGQRDWEAPDSEYNGTFEPHTTLGDNRPLRGWKASLYEGGVRVPALVNWPGRVPAGKTVTEPISILDWMPTFCGLAGHQCVAEPALEGADVWPAIAGDADLPERTFYWKTGSRFAVQQGDWKLLTNRSGNRPNLFNLAKDPFEKKDLAKDQPELVERLGRVLQQQKQLDP